MENKFKDRDISFETLEKAVNGDYFAMQEVIRLFKPYMARLSIEEGRCGRLPPEGHLQAVAEKREVP